MERGILFKREMIRAYLERRKTMTRRCKGLDQVNLSPNDWKVVLAGPGRVLFQSVHGQNQNVRYPYGGVGDEFYFKETFAKSPRGVIFRADFPQDEFGQEVVDIPTSQTVPLVWVSSMIMPRDLSRFRHVPILEVSVERLQQITPVEALAEGIKPPNQFPNSFDSFCLRYFKDLWNEINEANGLGWSRNPWVFVYRFPPYEK